MIEKIANAMSSFFHYKNYDGYNLKDIKNILFSNMGYTNESFSINMWKAKTLPPKFTGNLREHNVKDTDWVVICYYNNKTVCIFKFKNGFTVLYPYTKERFTDEFRYAETELIFIDKVGGWISQLINLKLKTRKIF